MIDTAGHRTGAEDSASAPGVLGAKSANKSRGSYMGKCPSITRKLRTLGRTPTMNHPRNSLTLVGIHDVSVLEKWLPIPSDPNYLVSAQGRVYSKRSKLVLKPRRRGKGYAAVALTGGRNAYIHHVVAEAWLGPRPAGLYVLHRDDLKTNNDVSNLYYGSQAENAADALRNGRHPQASRTHCIHGHPLEGENLYIRPRTGWRQCRTCIREQHQARKAAA